jgi:hypothetical protein
MPILAGDVYNPLAWLDEETRKKRAAMRKKGFVWNEKTGKYVKAGKPVLPGDKPAPNPPAPSGSGGGGGYSGGVGGGGGGGAAAAKGLSGYIQEYRLRFRPGASPPPALLKKAEANNWSLAYFDQQVRLKDKSYFRSIEAKKLIPDFNRTMKMLFPGLSDKAKQGQLMKSSFYKQQAMWYLRNGIGLMGTAGTEVLYGHLTNTNRWNQNNPYYKQYAKNADINVQKESNPLVYKELNAALKQSFKDMGMELPDDYYNAFFKSRYASSSGMKDLADNLSGIVQNKGSLGWFQGSEMDKGQVKTAAFGSNIPATDLRAKMSKAFGVRNSFLSNESKSFDTQLSQQSKLIKPLL